MKKMVLQGLALLHYRITRKKKKHEIIFPRPDNSSLSHLFDAGMNTHKLQMTCTIQMKYLSI